MSAFLHQQPQKNQTPHLQQKSPHHVGNIGAERAPKPYMKPFQSSESILYINMRCTRGFSAKGRRHRKSFFALINTHEIPSVMIPVKIPNKTESSIMLHNSRSLLFPHSKGQLRTSIQCIYSHLPEALINRASTRQQSSLDSNIDGKQARL